MKIHAIRTSNNNIRLTDIDDKQNLLDINRVDKEISAFGKILAEDYDISLFKTLVIVYKLSRLDLRESMEFTL